MSSSEKPLGRGDTYLIYIKYVQDWVYAESSSRLRRCVAYLLRTAILDSELSDG